MLGIADSCKNSVFKLLVTCPGISLALYQEFEAGEIVWLPKKVKPYGGLTPAKWEASVEPYVLEWLEDCMIE